MLTVSIYYDGPLYTQMVTPFERLYESWWFDDPLVCEWIKDIDQMTHVKDNMFNDRWGKAAAPTVMSSGSKALCLMKYQDEYPVFATRCGDNCVKYIERLSIEKDMHIVLQHCMPFSKGFRFFLTDTGTYVEGGSDWPYAFYDVRRKVGDAKLSVSN